MEITEEELLHIEECEAERDEEERLEELLFLEEQMNLVEEDDLEVDEVWFFSEDESENENENGLEHLNTLHDSSNKRPNLPNDKRRQLILELFLSASSDLNLPRGIVTTTATRYGVSRWCVNRLWREAKKQRINGEEVNVASKKHKCGRKPLITDEEVLKEVPLKQRTTIRSFAHALNVSPSTVYRLIKRGILRSHTNSIKPKLTEKHKHDRLEWILKWIVPGNVTSKPIFDMLQNVVHIDEKWFFMSKVTQRFYLLSEEQDPYRACQSKNFIPKVMFLAAIARAQFQLNGDIKWDGKIDIFPFTEEVQAQRGSINRPRGTIETKAKQNITKETIRAMIIDQLLPKIREKWPTDGCKTIWIQQDNARPHIHPNDPAFLEAANKDGFHMHLIQQPAQSPDLNVLDLGFFAAIQSIQHKTFPDTVQKLIQSVKDAYDCYDPRTINHTWLQLMYGMVEILKVKGGNNYKAPHKGKKQLERLGQLPTYVEVPHELVVDTMKHLNENIIFQATTNGSQPIEEGSQSQQMI